MYSVEPETLKNNKEERYGNSNGRAVRLALAAVRTSLWLDVVCLNYGQDDSNQSPISTAASSLNCRNVDLLHCHHHLECALGGRGIGICDRLH